MLAGVTSPRYPSLFQVNTRVWLTELARSLGRKATLDDVPDGELDRLAGLGFDWVWLLSVWQTGPAGSRSRAAIRSGAGSSSRRCPICATRTSAARASPSPATPCTTTSAARPRWPACASGSDQRGLRLMLDFVPNHTGLDHPWVEDHPEYYVAGTERDLARAPQNYTWVKGAARRSAPGPRARSLLFGLARHPAAQLRQPGHAGRDARRAAEDRRAVRRRALRHGHAGAARGLRAHLGHPGRSPSGRRRRERVREQAPGFCFMAEVYWDLEWTLQQQGFDYTYDKRLYDRLREGHARPVREHFHAGLDYQDRLARFLENHDEPRAAATFPRGMHEAAAVDHLPVARAALLPPGPARGQRRADLAASRPRARRARRSRARSASTTGSWRCCAGPTCATGDWQLLECAPAWDGNWTLRTASWPLPGRRRRAAPGRRELRREPEPVLCPAAVLRSGRRRLAPREPAGRRVVRSRRRRSESAGSLPRRRALEGRGLQPDATLDVTG